MKEEMSFANENLWKSVDDFFEGKEKKLGLNLLGGGGGGGGTCDAAAECCQCGCAPAD